ncbi:hypothetical protein FT641_20040 [Bacillus paranthracis]|uniref:hypothetical protein n=1 Tax=Bacillus paranthracis TaxID=2026186 RepID=UPI001879A34D|nr:hypothetical protein [Bacillus paranthracis]MBE7114647.1 hypothetical protein [Bacillus paranthracis]MBE7154986.1 hypothetical protein [Bacillus paranthracis]
MSEVVDGNKKQEKDDLDSAIGVVLFIILVVVVVVSVYLWYLEKVETGAERNKNIAAEEIKREETHKANSWAASKVDKAETKMYEVKEYSKLEPSVLGEEDENINSRKPRFKFVGVTKDADAPMVYESTISYTNHKGELNSVTQNVYVVYTDEINKPELRVKEVKKDGSKYAKDVAVNPTLYLPNNK